MTDKELLELAAKGAGIKAKWFKVRKYSEANGARWLCGTTDVFGTHHSKPWNPLTDDGDAMRLAADLRLKVLPGRLPGDGCTVESQRQGIAGCTTFRDDKREQMRRAIVHVAAEIGKAMP